MQTCVSDRPNRNAQKVTRDTSSVVRPGRTAKEVAKGLSKDCSVGSELFAHPHALGIVREVHVGLVGAQTTCDGR